MTTLPDEEIRAIAKDVALANAVPVEEILTAPFFDSEGKLAVRVTILMPPGHVSSIVGERYMRTVTGIMSAVADRGEERLALAEIGEKKSAS
jgi:hypothetical protein